MEPAVYVLRIKRTILPHPGTVLVEDCLWPSKPYVIESDIDYWMRNSRPQ